MNPWRSNLGVYRGRASNRQYRHPDRGRPVGIVSSTRLSRVTQSIPCSVSLMASCGRAVAVRLLRAATRRQHGHAQLDVTSSLCFRLWVQPEADRTIRRASRYNGTDGARCVGSTSPALVREFKAAGSWSAVSGRVRERTRLHIANYAARTAQGAGERRLLVNDDPQTGAASG